MGYVTDVIMIYIYIYIYMYVLFVDTRQEKNISCKPESKRFEFLH